MIETEFLKNSVSIRLNTSSLFTLTSYLITCGRGETGRHARFRSHHLGVTLIFIVNFIQNFGQSEANIIKA